MSRPPSQGWRPRLPTGDLVVIAEGAHLRRVGDVDLSHAGRSAKGARYFGEGRAVGLMVMATVDHTHHGKLLHVSLSYPDADPGWSVVKAVRAAFFPDGVDVGMLLPKARDYVNHHEHCFHLWQLPVERGIG